MTASPKDTSTIAELIATTAVLNTKLDGAISQISELKGRFDAFQAGFIRVDVYNIKHEELVRQVALNQRDIESMKKIRWVMPTVSLVLGGVLVFLINFALTHGGK